MAEENFQSGPVTDSRIMRENSVVAPDVSAEQARFNQLPQNVAASPLNQPPGESPRAADFSEGLRLQGQTNARGKREDSETDEVQAAKNRLLRWLCRIVGLRTGRSDTQSTERHQNKTNVTSASRQSTGVNVAQRGTAVAEIMRAARSAVENERATDEAEKEAARCREAAVFQDQYARELQLVRDALETDPLHVDEYQMLKERALLPEHAVVMLWSYNHSLSKNWRVHLLPEGDTTRLTDLADDARRGRYTDLRNRFNQAAKNDGWKEDSFCEARFLAAGADCEREVYEV